MDKIKAFLKKFADGFKSKWSALSKKVKIILIAGISVIIVSSIILAVLLNRTDYAVLYTGTSSAEASEVLSYVQNDLGIQDIRVESGGRILVPKEQVEDIRIKLASKGYPKSGFNYDIWGKNISMFSTETEIRETQKQQLQANLMATFSAIEGVDRAVVMLSIPDSKDYVITADKKKSSASVVLYLKEGVELSAESIIGIFNVVETAVPNLMLDDITVTDGNGRQMFPDAEPDLTEKNNADIALEYKRIRIRDDMESSLETKLYDMMSNLFPNVQVGVSVLLNFDKNVKEIIDYSPSVTADGTHGGMIYEEDIKKAGGNTGTVGGEVGTTTNADISPDYPTMEGVTNGDTYIDEARNIKYKVNETKSQVEKNGFSVDKVTASVAVDDTNMTQAVKDEYQKLVAFAIGTDVANVSFVAQPFPLKPPTDDGNLVVIDNGANSFVYIIITLGCLLIALLILALVTSGSKRRRHMKAQREAIASGGMAIPGRPGSLPGLEEDVKRVEPVSVEQVDDVASLQDNSEHSREAALKREIRDFSKTNPEIVAQLIRSWMRDEN